MFDRSGASSGGNKLDPMPSPAGSTPRITFKNEQEKTTVSRELSGGPIKERPFGKVNVKYVSPIFHICQLLTLNMPVLLRSIFILSLFCYLLIYFFT